MTCTNPVVVQRYLAIQYGLCEPLAVGNRIEAPAGGIENGRGVAPAAGECPHLRVVDQTQVSAKGPPLFDELGVSGRPA